MIGATAKNSDEQDRPLRAALFDFNGAGLILRPAQDSSASFLVFFAGLTQSKITPYARKGPAWATKPIAL